MIIDSEKDRLVVSIPIHDVFNLMSGSSVREETRQHIIGVFAEWYHDTWLDRIGDPKEKQEEKNKNANA